MARIPSVADIRLPTPQPQREISTDQSGIILGQGLSTLGNAAIQAADEAQARQSQLEQTQARSALLISDIKTRQSLADDPNWQTYESRYQDQMSKAIDAAEQSISGTQEKQLFHASAQADMARGSAAVADQARQKRMDIGHANTLNSIDALRTSALQAPDEPTRASAVTAAHQLIQASVANGDLKAEEGVVMQKQWTTSYSQGAVTMLPYDKQIGLLSRPQGTVADFIAPDKREEMLQHAILAKHIEEERAVQMQKQREEMQQKITQNDFLERMQDGKLTTHDILASNLAPFGSGSKDEFLNMMKAGATKTDPALFNELFTRIHLSDGSNGKMSEENQLNSYVTAGQLSMEDLTKLRNEIQGDNTTEGKSESTLKNGLFEVAKSTLTRSNPLIGLRDPIGDENLQRFTSWFLDEYRKERNAGKTPHQLLSPDSSDYLGSRLSSYVRSPQQIMQDTLNSATQAPATSAPARKDGESPDDYLKRIGKK